MIKENKMTKSKRGNGLSEIRKEKTMKTKKLFLAAALMVLLLATPQAQNGSVKFYGPLSRYITPNAGGLNGNIIFCFDNPADSGALGSIYDLRGSRVAQTSQNLPLTSPPPGGSGSVNCPQGFLPQYVYWDGRSLNGGVVNSGVYIYEILISGRAYTGTVVVVR